VGFPFEGCDSTYFRRFVRVLVDTQCNYLCQAVGTLDSRKERKKRKKEDRQR